MPFPLTIGSILTSALAAADGDTFISSSLSLHVNAAPPPHVPT
jgi:hypothetical protein